MRRRNMTRRGVSGMDSLLMLRGLAMPEFDSYKDRLTHGTIWWDSEVYQGRESVGTSWLMAAQIRNLCANHRRLKSI